MQSTHSIIIALKSQHIKDITTPHPALPSVSPPHQQQQQQQQQQQATCRNQ